MPLTRTALDELLDSLHEELAQRRARDAAGAELDAWLDRCAEVILGFACEEDRAWVQARLEACFGRSRLLA